VTPEGYSITTDRECLDVEAIFDYLSNHAYWARGRSHEPSSAPSMRLFLRTRDAHELYERAGFARITNPESYMVRPPRP
jgi:hypothetical protein